MPDVINENGTWVIQPDVNLANLDLEVIDVTDGSWTLVDNNSGIKSQAFEDGAVKITTNAISAGSLNQLNQSTYDAPRWYKKLKDSSGVQLTQDSEFIFIARHQPMSSSNPASDFGIAVGISLSPTSVGNNAFSGGKQGWMGGNVMQTTAGSNDTFTIQVFGPGGLIGTPNLTTGSFAITTLPLFGKSSTLNMVTSPQVAGSYRISKVMSSNFTGSVDLHIQVGLTNRYNSHSAPDNSVLKQKIAFKVIKIG
jgi:hypothetical protein